MSVATASPDAVWTPPKGMDPITEEEARKLPVGKLSYKQDSCACQPTEFTFTWDEVLKALRKWAAMDVNRPQKAPRCQADIVAWSYNACQMSTSTGISYFAMVK